MFLIEYFGDDEALTSAWRLPSAPVRTARATNPESRGFVEWNSSLPALQITTLAQISHKNIVRFLGFVKHDSRTCLVFELAPRGSVRDLIKNGPLSLLRESRESWLCDIGRGKLQELVQVASFVTTKSFHFCSHRISAHLCPDVNGPWRFEGCERSSLQRAQRKDDR